MAIPTEISSLLRMYSSKQNSPTVIIQNFSEYLVWFFLITLRLKL